MDGRVVERNQDPERMGRWSSLNIQVKGSEILFITAYRPCRSQINLDANTAYVQQWRAIGKETTRIDPRSKMMNDL